MSRLTRRKLLMFFGCSAAATAVAPKIGSSIFGTDSGIAQAQTGNSLSFTPLKLAHPLEAYENNPSFLPIGINGQGTTLAANQDMALQGYQYFDDVIVPPEYERYVIVKWGDRVFPNQEEYFGYNSDYISFIPINGNPNDGYLWNNHEYVSYPMSPLLGGDDLIGFPTTDQIVLGFDLSQPNIFTFGEFAYNQGGSIVRITKDSSGRYTPVVGDSVNRRVHLLSGLAINAERSDGYQGVTSWGPLSYQTGDQNYLEGTGAAASEVFPLSSDGLGNRIIGTAFNCSGGTTPWGTILTAEENFQGTVTEDVLPNGTQTGYDEESGGFTFGLVGEKYGWMVEISPADPSFRNKKHTALGRFRHENIAFRTEAGRPLVAYMGDDRRGGHTYKFVSNGIVSNPTDPNNSQLFEDGILYVARLNPDNSGQWIPLVLTTPTNPLAPSQIAEAELNAFGQAQRDGRILLPQRSGIAGASEDGGSFIVDLTNEQTALPAYQNRTLADFYTSQGAVLVDAFLASNLVGGTPTARPEDLEIHPGDGSVFIAYTDNAPGGDGYPDSRIFIVSKYSPDINAAQQFGGLYRIIESGGDATSTTFSWSRFEQSGEDGAISGAGFANVDNLEIDTKGNIWGVTDMSTSLHNGFDTGPNGEQNEIDHTITGDISSLVGVFGNNWLFYIPVVGPNAGSVVPFAYGPPRCEMTGPYFVRNGNVDETLLLSVQHPGESSPIGDGVNLTRTIEMLGLDGTLFNQQRTVPRGSNWPSNILGDASGPPRPSVIGIRRRDGGAFV